MTVGSMQQALAIASLTLFVALAVTFYLVLRRASHVVAVTREDEGFRHDAAALTDRAATYIADACERIDRVRRHQDPPDSLDGILPATLEALVGLRAEIETLAAPTVLVPLRDRIADEMGRAGRAVKAVQHGCALLGVTAGRPHELEGETSIKRGYLNLMHAREALMTLGVDLRSGRVDARRWFSDRPPTG